MKFFVNTVMVLVMVTTPLFSGEYRSLFNGNDLTGWRTITGEDTAWRAENGVLVGRHFRTSAYDQLGTDSIYDNFTLRFKYKSITGNSGFFFRGEPVGASGMSGHQVLTTQVNEAGGLWETHGRNWIIRPDARTKSYYIPDDWNQWEIHAYGRHITLYLNDSLIGDLPNDPGRLEGIFAVKMHGGQGYIEVHIKDIEMADTTRQGCMDSTAQNFDPYAFKDDGNCEPVGIDGKDGRKINLREKISYSISGNILNVKSTLQSNADILIYTPNGNLIYKYEITSLGHKRIILNNKNKGVLLLKFKSKTFAEWKKLWINSNF